MNASNPMVTDFTVRRPKKQPPAEQDITFQREQKRCLETVHSKNTRVKINPDSGPRGPDPFLGLLDPESVSV